MESFASLAFRLRADYTHTIAIDADTGLELLRRPKHKKTRLTGVWDPIDPWTPSMTICVSVHGLIPTGSA
jgi:vitamin B12 transporter